ncbi:C45 family autoproteolytic acyltransferase/hydrolase [Olsenella sp. YH-ols2217]|uniref:C45 family autoproteolytic acyltransferase/hydrolase n=1 Tax=Kribbibacterium absianum TaxID=3044210 RepID=A0ABT6ZHF5_9ACTN|nr:MULTISPECIES: C45 family peptidase [unclassified Olsenella]MDJ1120984.1 C45 family autoproteolytic acyltransferase/hydrolase [Olsenella sp. YH-ols2216]MDJ1128475.1 C45 family autoproteolytic acyltransferase/hydrolase [Olsenella sp. YH-ols2217]
MAELTQEQQAIVAKGSRRDINGWLHVKVQGSPYECGFQEGYLTADEYADAMRVYDYMTYQVYGMTYQWFVEQAVKLHKDKIPEDLMEELQGMADGLTAAGVPQTVDDLIGWNAYYEITGYWWPLNAPKVVGAMPENIMVPKASHCSAIAATGSATKDGKPVLGHESFDDFWSGQYFNVCLDITPEKGNRIVMQTVPCYLDSMTDYYVTSAGLAITETTLAGFSGYDDNGVPEYVRVRQAAQYATDIDSFVEIIDKGNNGGYANAWLIADTNTGEIARYEQGLKFQALEKKTGGCFFGCNAVFDPRIRNLECKDNGFNDPRQQTGARRQRWMELIDQYEGRIDVDVVKKMLADTYDVYLGYNNPSSRCICSHYDQDPQYYADDPNAVWNIPFYPAGSCDGKCAGYDDIRSMHLWGRYGRADGVEFDVDEFFREHPLWKWQEGYLKSRPTQPWTYFD